MRFTKVRLIGLATTDLPIVGALPSDRYILKNMDGLGPPEINVTIADTLNAGGVFQSKRPNNREVVLQVGLNPDAYSGETVSDLRATMYGLLTPGTNGYIEIKILNDTTVIGKTTGYVKKLEINPFNKDPEVQITIATTQPYWQAENVLFVDPEGTKLEPTITNVGTAPTGVHFQIIFTANVPEWRIEDANGNYMAFPVAFLSGDTLTFDTRAGVRTVKRTRLGTTVSLLSALQSGSSWFTLYGGVNTFTASHDNYVWGDVYYTPLYWGF